jgi:hypothetical protein
MVTRTHLDDLHFRLRRLREDLLARRLEDWRLEELEADCRSLLAGDPRTPYAGALGFIAEMVAEVRRSRATQRELARLRGELERLGAGDLRTRRG